MRIIKAIDIEVSHDNVPVESEGIAYYRLPDGFLEFLNICEKKHGILGFEWEPGDRNFGVVLKKEEI